MDPIEPTRPKPARMDAPGERLHLLGEKKALRQMLVAVPPGNVLDRKSLEGRLRVVEQRIARVQAAAHAGEAPTGFEP